MNLFTRKGKAGDNSGAVLDDKRVVTEDAAEAEETGTVETSRAMGPHILMVEDDPMIRRTTREYFELNGYPATACGTIEEARIIVRETPPRMIILDGNLPDGSGFDFCRELRDRFGYAAPLFFYTALSGRANMTAGYKAGCTDYIVKPFVLDLLLIKARKYLELYEGRTLTEDSRCDTESKSFTE